VREDNGLDVWRRSILEELIKEGKGCLKKKIRCPQSVDPRGNVWIVDKNRYPILVILRSHMPKKLSDWVNHQMSQIWWEHREKKFPHLKQKEKASREEPEGPPPLHFACHASSRNKFDVYSEILDKMGMMKKLLPMWIWSQKVVDSMPEGYLGISKGIPVDKKIAGTNVSGLVLNFDAVAFHHDMNDVAPAILSYFEGPHTLASDGDAFYGGEFVVRCMGLQLVVDPLDTVIFESNIFHEVHRPMGVRFNITSMFKAHPNIQSKENSEHTWLFLEHFGIPKQNSV